MNWHAPLLPFLPTLHDRNFHSSHPAFLLTHIPDSFAHVADWLERLMQLRSKRSASDVVAVAGWKA